MDQVEKELAGAICGALKPFHSWVRKESKLFSSQLANADNPLARALGFCPVLHPDVDICLKRHSGQLDGVELKVIGSKSSRAFYTGIGQALALHRYGFDHSALWVVFESEEDLRRLGSAAWYFVRNSAMLALDFTPYLLEHTHANAVSFRVWQYDGPGDCHPTASYLGDHMPCFRHATHC